MRADRGSPGSRPPRPPSSTVAALLSLASPGVGHVYVARGRRGALWVLAWLTVELPLTAALMRVSPRAALVVLVVLAIAIWGGAAFDAARLAARAPRRGSWKEVAATLMLLVAIERLESLLLTRWIVEPIVIVSGSMTPTLRAGDHVLVDKTHKAPAVGDVVLVRGPERADERLPLRVVATGGQRVEVKARRLWIDGSRVPRCDVGPARLVDPSAHVEVADEAALEGELWLERLGDRAWLTVDDAVEIASRGGRAVRPIHVREDAGPWTVRAGELFVLGDDRDRARDSRAWLDAGFALPLANVEGRVFALSYSDTATSLRFDRAGLDPSGRPRLPSELASLKPRLERCLAPDAPLE